MVRCDILLNEIFINIMNSLPGTRVRSKKLKVAKKSSASGEFDIIIIVVDICYSGLHLQGEGHQGAGLIRAVGILWPFELYFESLHADLEAIHGLDGSLGTGWVIEAHKA
ncbi:uncharacterized [Tachysurus ichikawai]